MGDASGSTIPLVPDPLDEMVIHMSKPRVRVRKGDLIAACAIAEGLNDITNAIGPMNVVVFHVNNPKEPVADPKGMVELRTITTGK